MNSLLIARARKALNSLEQYLEDEYSSCAIHNEADAHVAVVEHLKRELRAKDGRWIIGANHRSGSTIPDVLCYYTPWDGEEFRKCFLEAQECLVAVIEIKWAKPLSNDLAKMRTFQRGHQSVLAWMVYGGHFSAAINKKYAAEDIVRQERITSWVNEFSDLRGQTVVQCGELESKHKRCDRIRAMRKHWWINDTEEL